MKNEGRIMEAKDMDGLSNKEKGTVKKIEGSTSVAGAENKSIIPRNVKGVQSTLNQFGVKESVEEKGVPESMNDKAWKDKITPEIVEKLKRLKNFSVEIEINGEKQTKTGQDVLEAMGKLGKEDLTSEQKHEAMLEGAKLWGELAQKYETESVEGKELRNILFNNVLAGGEKEKGEKLYGWFQAQANAIKEGGGEARIDFDGLGEIMGLKLDGKKMSELGELIKQVPLPEGVKAAPIVTVKDGKIEIVPAPRGEEAARVAPAPGEGGGISKTETPGISGDESQDSGEGGENKKKVIEEEEKKKFDWWKYRNGLLFFLILYMGVQGWYAKMWEQLAERAR